MQSVKLTLLGGLKACSMKYFKSVHSMKPTLLGGLAGGMLYEKGAL